MSSWQFRGSKQFFADLQAGTRQSNRTELVDSDHFFTALRKMGISHSLQIHQYLPDLAHKRFVLCQQTGHTTEIATHGRSPSG